MDRWYNSNSLVVHVKYCVVILEKHVAQHIYTRSFMLNFLTIFVFICFLWAKISRNYSNKAGSSKVIFELDIWSFGNCIYVLIYVNFEIRKILILGSSTICLCNLSIAFKWKAIFDIKKQHQHSVVLNRHNHWASSWVNNGVLWFWM